mmetsp:Transcript_26722/g.68466  ORF Transcript_26722/g.68466 Transcript_26722/m.68466 type:complete len:83 (-) Transcript_26722:82-330(-)
MGCSWPFTRASSTSSCKALVLVLASREAVCGCTSGRRLPKEMVSNIQANSIKNLSRGSTDLCDELGQQVKLVALLAVVLQTS